MDLVMCELQETKIDGVESFSPFCAKVRMALKAAGLPFTSRRASHPAAFRALNPTGQVPVLLVDGDAVSDSTRILSRIEQLAPGRLDRGLDARGRAESLLWEEMADTVLNGFLVASRWDDDANWPAVEQAYFGAMPAPLRWIVPRMARRKVRATLNARDVTRQGNHVLWSRFEQTLDALDDRAPASGQWLGADLSRADIAIGAQLLSLLTPLTPWQAERVRARGRLASYLERTGRACAARELGTSKARVSRPDTLRHARAKETADFVASPAA
jgi:glutathione S-transferase